MVKQFIFAGTLLLTLGVFSYTLRRLIALFKQTRKGFPIKQIGKRIIITLRVAIGQTKIMRKPIIGFMHALVFWGFCVILIGSVEVIIDGLAGTERVLGFLGPVYDVIVASGDVFAFLILVLIIIFLFRRIFLNIRRFGGVEMKHKSHVDANFALSLILLLMVSLLGTNIFYILHEQLSGDDMLGVFPVSQVVAGWISGLTKTGAHTLHEINWWSHILFIFFFANYLPYSKHFHVFMSVPNVFLSRLEPLGKLINMDNVTKEVKLMLDPSAEVPEDEEDVQRFGVLDVEDVNWKNYFDSLACTQCGRCTEVCPANLTGKKLSPRKLMMDLRARMKEKGPGLIKEGREFADKKSLIKDFFTAEEIWACTTCNACAQECPININHPSLIVDLRRYIVMEEAGAPAELNTMFSNIENNGAPWQFSQEDRMNWDENNEARIFADLHSKGESPEYLVWIGSAGAFDDRYKKVTRSFIKLLNYLNVDYAVLGTEESSSGDVARRAGNEMLFQMQAMMNIEILQGYGVQKIITCDPHAFNTFKNEYPDLGGDFDIIHHSQFLKDLINSGKLKVNHEIFKGKRITYHDPCYLGRANGEYQAPREVLSNLGAQLVEMKRSKSFALCCGAGGGQMFKEAEKGDKEVFVERTNDALETGAEIIVTACPYCMVMLTDGLKYASKEEEVKNFDLAELVAEALEL
ncbi:MAG: (Fe-S)-binding protein [Bacteroidota bacterium]|nr:(Fe-S)-binding protein [Bacteroidota bacterium]